MKRDVDLCRQLLMDIESQAAECSMGALRADHVNGADDRIRYHLRLLIDAGLVKETERTSAGVPCVRLTNAGHEFIELSRSESRWREVKWVASEQSGGLSLIVMRSLLAKWAVEAAVLGDRNRRWRDGQRRYHHSRPEPSYRRDPGWFRFDGYHEDPDSRAADDESRFVPGRYGVRDHRENRERFNHQERYDDRDAFRAYETDVVDAPVSITLPLSLV